MTYKKFESSDLFYNTIKTKPRFEFKIWNGKAQVNSGTGLALLNDMLILPIDYTPPVPPVCGNPNSFDFSCEENSHNISLI